MPSPGHETHRRGTLERLRAGEFEHASAAEKARAVAEQISKTSAAAAASALQPVPFVDAVILPPMQHHMVRSIGLIHGCHLDDSAVRRMFREMRRPIIAAQATIAVAKIVQVIPFVPEALAVSIAYALTHAIGEVSDHYLSKPGMRVEEMKPRFAVISKERFGEAFRVKRDELRALFRRPEIRRQIGELKKAHREGKIDEGEEARRMDAILGDASHRSSRQK